tara:strand:- start:255 stop:1142 length:888 start_codon:yes stop_codon:yes gene_type:complete
MLPNYKNVVIGGDLRAAIYAYVNDYPLIFTQPKQPYRFDYFSSTVDLNFFGIPSTVQGLRTPDGLREVGVAKILLWERIIFLLSLQGNLPLSDFCDKMRYDGEKIVCTNEYSKIYEFIFDTCHYFGDDNISGIGSLASLNASSYLCHDYIAFHKGGKHEIDYISTGDDFVGEIWFYSSDRIDGNTGVKDACVVSVLTEAQLSDPNYSETIARFKMEKILYDNGIKGPLNGYTPNGRPKHYRIKTSHIRREKRLLNDPQYKSSFKIKCPDLNIEELLCSLKEVGLGQFEQLKCDYT